MTDFPAELFRGSLPGLNRALTISEREMASKYLKLLVKWQKVHRLVGSVDPRWLLENIIEDSIAFFGALPPDVRRIADVGSGAGVPGVPLAIVRRDLAVTLIESRRRRVSFLSTVARELELENVEVLGARVEHIASQRRGQYDAVVMRCTEMPAAVLPHALDLVRPMGVVVMTARRDLGDRCPPSAASELVAVPMGGGVARQFRCIHKPG